MFNKKTLIMLRIVVVGAATAGVAGLGFYNLKEQPARTQHDGKIKSLPPVPSRSEQVSFSNQI